MLSVIIILVLLKNSFSDVNCNNITEKDNKYDSYFKALKKAVTCYF